MKVIFRNDELEYLMYVENVWKYPQWVLKSYQKRVAELSNLENSFDMFRLKILDVEELKWNMRWYFSARLNKWWRLIFRILRDWTIEIVEIYGITNHYQ